MLIDSIYKAKAIHLKHPSGEINGRIKLDGSKSISNRVLLIRALCGSDFEIEGCSTSNDTIAMERYSKGEEQTIDVGHAGTTMRFLTAFYAQKEGDWILTGSERMQNRPIGVLVDALRSLGAEIDYLGKEGYPPLKIKGKALKGGSVKVNAGISSQFLSALLLIAPNLEKGLELELVGDLVSKPYLEMTLGIMDYFGAKSKFEDQEIEVQPTPYQAKDFQIEADWSAASYHFAIASLAAKARLELVGLQETSFQGDAIVKELYTQLNTSSSFTEKSNLVIKSNESFKPEEPIFFNCLECPDIAQTLAVSATGLNQNCDFTGLKTLAIKETDRTEALKVELAKVGIEFNGGGDEWHLNTKSLSTNNLIPRFATYHDHRMAMAFAPLALKLPQGIIIEDPAVVKKSYPKFWEDLIELGFEIEVVN